MVASIEVEQPAAPLLTIPLDAVVRDPKSRDAYAVYVVADAAPKRAASTSANRCAISSRSAPACAAASAWW